VPQKNILFTRKARPYSIRGKGNGRCQRGAAGTQPPDREDISWLVPHQANKRIIDATASRMGLSSDKVMVNIQRYGNTTSGTIPLCLWDWESQLKKGDNLVLSAFGGGFTWGATLVKWVSLIIDTMTDNEKTLSGIRLPGHSCRAYERPDVCAPDAHHASSTFVYDDAEQGMRRFSGEEPGYIYTRWGNPTFTEAEEKIAAMEAFGIRENGSPLQLKALLQSSGMAAISTLLLMNLKSGDKVLTHFSLYGGTQEILQNVLPSFGITPVIVDLRDLDKAAAALRADPAIRMLYIETLAMNVSSAISGADIMAGVSIYSMRMAGSALSAAAALSRSRRSTMTGVMPKEGSTFCRIPAYRRTGKKCVRTYRPISGSQEQRADGRHSR